MARYRIAIFLIVAGFFLYGIVPVLPTAATPNTTIVVDSLADAAVKDGNCTLREAVEAAGTNTAVDGCAAGSPVGQDTITFSVDGTVFLSSELVVGGGITLQGNGQNKTIFDGQKTTRVIRLHESGRGDIVLRDLAIQNGDTAGELFGAGIYGNNHGHALLLERVTLRANKAEWAGGGLYITLNDGVVATIRSSTFHDNAADDGGAILASPEPAHTGCDGGVVIENTLFKDNVVTNFGGAISTSCGSLTVSHSTLSANQANSEAGFGGGGAIFAWRSTVTIINSTLSGNDAGNGGGAIHAKSDFFFSTLLEVRNSTIVGNAPANLYLHSSDADSETTAVFIDNLIGNYNAVNCFSSWGANASPPTIISLGYNLTDSDDCSFDEATDMLITSMVLLRSLGSLQDSGGPTPTHALQPGNPAIDAGSCSGNNVTDDQRGIPRPQGDGCDIGAFEYQENNTVYLPVVLR